MDIKEIRRCKNCDAWFPEGCTDGKGECRINPPMADKNGEAIWPKPHGDKCCFAFTITKEKLERLKAMSIVEAHKIPPIGIGR